MTFFNDFINIIQKWDPESPAIVCKRRTYSYSDVISKVNSIKKSIKSNIPPGSRVMLKSSMSFEGICAFLALCDQMCTIVPLSENSIANQEKFFNISQSQFLMYFDTFNVISAILLSGVDRSTLR